MKVRAHLVYRLQKEAYMRCASAYLVRGIPKPQFVANWVGIAPPIVYKHTTILDVFRWEALSIVSPYSYLVNPLVLLVGSSIHAPGLAEHHYPGHIAHDNTSVLHHTCNKVLVVSSLKSGL